MTARWGRYPAYEDSGVEWLGDVPAEWSVAPLKSRLIERGNGVWGDEPDGGEEDVLCVRVADFDRLRGGLSLGDDPTMRRVPANAAAARLLRPGNLLLEKSGGGEKQPVGFAVLVPSDIPRAVCSNFVSRVAVRGDTVPAYANYLLRAMYDARANCRFIKQSTGIQNLDSKGYFAEHAPFPSAREQQAIAAFLDRETGRIDALIAKKDRVLSLLDERRISLISRFVTKGLRPGAPMKPSGVGWIGDMPEHWVLKRLKFSCKLETGHTPNRGTPEYWVEEECTIPWVSLNDSKALAKVDVISETAFKISARGIANSSAHVLPAGAVAFTRDATIGLAAILGEPMAVSQHVIAWVCRPEMLNWYLLYAMYAMRPALEEFTAGSTLKTIGMPDVNRLVSPVPPLDEQREIVSRIKHALGSLDRLREQQVKSRRLLQEQRQALITAAVTGQIDVRGEAALPEAK